MTLGEIAEAGLPRIGSRMREVRTALQGEHGRERFSVRACAERAGLAESTWWTYERGEAEPPVTAALAIARVLSTTVEALDFRRLDVPA